MLCPFWAYCSKYKYSVKLNYICLFLHFLKQPLENLKLYLCLLFVVHIITLLDSVYLELLRKEVSTGNIESDVSGDSQASLGRSRDSFLLVVQVFNPRILYKWCTSPCPERSRVMTHKGMVVYFILILYNIHW